MYASMLETIAPPSMQPIIPPKRVKLLYIVPEPFPVQHRAIFKTGTDEFDVWESRHGEKLGSGGPV
jgi:hypothetical protein